MSQFSAEEYAWAIARNILSGNNTCGTLQKAIERNDSTYFIKMAIPVIDALVSQLRQAETERDKTNAANSQTRFLLETIVQNLFPSQEDPSVLSIQKTETLEIMLKDVLGRDIHW